MIKDTSQQDTLVVAPKSGKLKKLILAGVILVLSALTWQVTASWLSQDISIARDQLKLAKVERGDLLRDVVASGKIVAANAPVLYSPEQGLVTMMVKPGDRVQPGQVVANINSPQLMAQLNQQKTLVLQLASNFNREKLNARRKQLDLQQKLELAKVDLAAAERGMNRADKSIKSQLISHIDYEKAQDDLAKARLHNRHAKEQAELAKDTLAFEVENKQLELKAQQQVLTELQRKVKELSISSPVEGIVGNWLVEQKAKVAGNQALMTVVDLSAYEAELQVPESYADELGLGMTVEINIGGKQLSGQLASISPEVIENQVTARVRMATDKEAGLRQNQRVSGRIILEQKKNVLMVRRGQFYQSGGGRIGYKVTDGIAERIALESGASSMSHIELLNGVKEGDTLVVSDLAVFDKENRVVLN